jgi:DNA-binding LacI/PurR family transcriptional regulator
MCRHKVSQSVVCKALLTLTHEGLIESHVGRGTFVRGDARLRRVLWVCGVDLTHGDISPFYTHQLRIAKDLCATRGLSVDPVWLCNSRLEEHEPYCVASVLDRYVGFVFSGCGGEPEHRFKRYVMRNEAVPSVSLTVWPPRSGEVAGDVARIAEEGLGWLKSRGHATVSLVTPEDAPHRQAAMRAAADRAGVRLQWVQMPDLRWATAFQAAGYRLAEDMVAAGELPRAIFITDDTVAQGFTRGLLAKCRPEQLEALDIVIATARQTVMPLGLPAVFVVSDIEDLVTHALQILMDQIEGRTGRPDSYCGLVSLLTDQAQQAAAAGLAATAAPGLPTPVRAE